MPMSASALLESGDIVEAGSGPVYLVNPNAVDVDEYHSWIDPFPLGAYFIVVRPEPGKSLRESFTSIDRDDIPSIIVGLQKILADQTAPEEK